MNFLESDCFFEGSSGEFNIPSEDIWKKFEFLNTPPNSPSLSHVQDWASEKRSLKCELKHDCMWSGTCQSAEHRTKPFSFDPVNSETDYNLPASPNVSASDVDSESELSTVSEREKIIPPHFDHCYGTSRRRETNNCGLPTPSDSEEEPDTIKYTRQNTIDMSQLSEPLRRRLQMALASIVKQKSTSHVVEVPTGSGNKYLEVRLQSSNSLLDSRKVLTAKKPVINSIRRKTPIHNNMERQRRVDLRLAFQNLRDVLPELQSAQKASKAIILDNAIQTCTNLTSRNEFLSLQLKKQMDAREALVKRLKYLRSS